MPGRRLLPRSCRCSERAGKASNIARQRGGTADRLVLRPPAGRHGRPFPIDLSRVFAPCRCDVGDRITATARVRAIGRLAAHRKFAARGFS